MNFNSVRSPTGVANGAGSGSIGNAIDYPELNSPPLVRPPPPVASPSLSERQDSRPRVQQSYIPTNGVSVNGAPKPPRINSDYPVSYWSDVAVPTSGLKNLGNTCYMNAPIQCLSATVPFSRFFTEHRWKTAINFMNQLGSKGRLTEAFAKLLHDMRGGDLPYLTPIDFRVRRNVLLPFLWLTSCHGLAVDMFTEPTISWIASTRFTRVSQLPH